MVQLVGEPRVIRRHSRKHRTMISVRSSTLGLVGDLLTHKRVHLEVLIIAKLWVQTTRTSVARTSRLMHRSHVLSTDNSPVIRCGTCRCTRSNALIDLFLYLSCHSTRLFQLFELVRGFIDVIGT